MRRFSNQPLAANTPVPSCFPRLSWPVWFIPLLFLGLTLWGWQLAVQNETAVATARFHHSTDEVIHALRTRLTTYEQALAGAIALFDALGNVTRKQWHDYVASQQFSRRFPGIQGVGYTPWIAPDQVESFTQGVREEGFEGFSIKPAGVRQAYSSILYLEPFDWRNQRAFGYDMFSEPVRRAAMERARDTGQPALSGKVRLVQETDQDIQAGFLIYLPLYRGGVPLETVAQRRAALRGWVYAPFRMNDLMHGLMDGENTLLKVDIADSKADGGDDLMYRSNEAMAAGSYSQHGKEMIYGHPWWFLFTSSAVFDRAISSARSLLVLLFGLLIDLLIALMLYMFCRQQKRAHHMALLEGTGELADRLGTLIESLPDAIFFKDGAGRWQVVNSAGLKLFGLEDKPWHGLSDHDLAKRYPEMADAYQSCILDDERAWQRGARLDTIEEILNQQGLKTFEVTKVPLFKADGRRQGLVVIGRDVSERRQNEATERRLIESLRRLNEIAALSHLPLNVQLRRALALGNRHLGLEFGIVSHVVEQDYQILSQVSPPDTLQDNQVFELANTYCSITLTQNQVLAIHDMGHSAYQGHPCYKTFSLETYIGAPVRVNDQVYGTVNFTSPNPYERIFDEGDKEFVELLARWVGSVIEGYQAKQQLAANELQLQAIFENEPGCVKLMDQQGRLLKMNRAGLAMIDAENLEQVVGTELVDLVLPPYRAAFNRLTRRVFAGASGKLEFEICSLKQERRWLETHAVPLRSPEGGISALLAVTLDITERKTAEAEIERLAFFDPLTNLANRRLLLDRLHRALRVNLRRNCRGALLIVDLDHFKSFNDGLGHGMGDQLLQEVARRLLKTVRADDTVGRIGGDEFVVILENLHLDEATAGRQALEVAEKVRVAVAEPVPMDPAGRYPVTASIGLCVFSGQEGETGILFNHADQALYCVKHAGRNGVQLYSAQSASKVIPMLPRWRDE